MCSCRANELRESVRNSRPLIWFHHACWSYLWCCRPIMNSHPIFMMLPTIQISVITSYVSILIRDGQTFSAAKNLRLTVSSRQEILDALGRAEEAPQSRRSWNSFSVFGAKQLSRLPSASCSCYLQFSAISIHFCKQTLSTEMVKWCWKTFSDFQRCSVCYFL